MGTGEAGPCLEAIDFGSVIARAGPGTGAAQACVAIASVSTLAPSIPALVIAPKSPAYILKPLDTHQAKAAATKVATTARHRGAKTRPGSVLKRL